MAVCGTQARNVIVGPARIYMAPCDEPKPAFTPGEAISDADFDGTAWRELGFTQDGVEVNYTPDFGEVEVDQLKDAAVLFNQGTTVMINTNMVEATLENLTVAWGIPNSQWDAGSANGDDQVLSIGIPDSEADEKSLILVGRAPRKHVTVTATDHYLKRERVYYARRAVSMEGSNHSLRRSEATVFPVSFRLLPDANAGLSEYGTITDRLIEAVPA